MGAFDLLSDDDPRAVAHEEQKLRNKYGKELSEYTDIELMQEMNRRRAERTPVPKTHYDPKKGKKVKTK